MPPTRGGQLSAFVLPPKTGKPQGFPGLLAAHDDGYGLVVGPDNGGQHLAPIERVEGHRESDDDGSAGGLAGLNLRFG